MTKSLRPHEVAEYFQPWDAKLERLYQGCQIVITSFDPGASGYVISNGASVSMDRALLDIVDSLLRQLHPEWADDAEMSRRYRKRTTQKLKMCTAARSKAKRLGKGFDLAGREGQYVISGMYQGCYVYVVGSTPQEAYDKAVDQIKRYKTLIKHKATPYYWTYDNPKV